MRTVTGELGGFKKFLLRGNCCGLGRRLWTLAPRLAAVVQALVKDIITPLLGSFGGVPDFSTWTVNVGRTRIIIGDFLNALLSFLIIAFVIYFLVVLPVTKLMDRYRSEPQPAPTKECPECLSKIPRNARRCTHCTAQIEEPSEATINVMRRMAAPSGEDIADEAVDPDRAAAGTAVGRWALLATSIGNSASQRTVGLLRGPPTSCRPGRKAASHIANISQQWDS